MAPAGWSIARRLAAVVMLVVALAVVAAAPVITGTARAAALLSDVVLRASARPLAYLTPRPTVETLVWSNGGTGVLTLPGGHGRHAGFVVMLGAEPAAPDDPRVQRLTDGMARSGLATLLVRSPRLIDGMVTADEPQLLADAFRALRDHPRIRGGRAGFLGLSVGGSIAIVASTDPAIADQVWCVLAIGPHYDGRTLVASVAGHAYRDRETVVPWSPDDVATAIIARTLLDALPEADRAAIARGTEPATPDGRILRDLLRGTDLANAERLVAGLSEETQSRLDAVSPRGRLDRLRAPLYLVHDRHDAFIPWTESEALAAEGHPAVYERLDLLQHVDPRPADTGVLVRDGWRLLRLFTRILVSAFDSATAVQPARA